MFIQKPDESQKIGIAALKKVVVAMHKCKCLKENPWFD